MLNIFSLGLDTIGSRLQAQGIPVTVTCPEGCAASGTVTLLAAGGRGAARPEAAGSGSGRGRVTLLLTPSAKQARGLKSLKGRKLQIVVKATNTTTHRKGTTTVAVTGS